MTSNGYLDLGAFKAALERQQETIDIDVPGFGKLKLAKLNALESIEMLEYQESLGRETTASNLKGSIRVIAKAAVDSEGNRFLDNEEGVALVGQMKIDDVIHIGNMLLGHANENVAGEVDSAKKN